MNVNIIAIVGGSCSGKTTFANSLCSAFGESECSILLQDNYYHDQSASFDKDGGRVNFDHPSAIDFKLLCEHLELLKSGEPIQMPSYDFKTHTRGFDNCLFKPKKIILVDGILLLSQEYTRDSFDDSIFIQCDEGLRFKRRLERDTRERGRTPEGVKEQFYKQVNPMHIKFVEPSKQYAQKVLAQKEYLSCSGEIIEQFLVKYS